MEPQLLEKLSRCIGIMRKSIPDRKNVPAYWLELLLVVAAAGEDGINQMDAYAKVGMHPGIASRVVKLMSKYPGKSGEIEGYNLIKTEQDTFLRHRQRLFLTKKGLALIASIKR